MEERSSSVRHVLAIYGQRELSFLKMQRNRSFIRRGYLPTSVRLFGEEMAALGTLITDNVCRISHTSGSSMRIFIRGTYTP
jgi:hypothetical protein